MADAIGSSAAALKWACAASRSESNGILDGNLAVRFRGVYLDIEVCPRDERKPKPAPASKPVRKDHNRGGHSSWMRDYPISSAKPLWKAIRESNRNC